MAATLKSISLLAIGLIASNPLHAAKSLNEAQIGKLLEEGKRVMLQGHPDTAIDKYFDRVIESFGNQYKNEKRTLYVAHSPEESLLYLVSAAAAGNEGQVKGKSAGTVVIYGAWTDALVMKGYALFELRRPEDAKAALKRATELSPMYPPPWIELGAVYQEEKDWPATLDAFQHAEDGAEFLPDEASKKTLQARAWRGKAFVYTEQGKLDDSEALYKKCLALDPEDGSAKRELEYIKSLRARPVDTPPPATPAK
jgi:tetratricopeptide (TPR) repeat protein